MSESTPSVTPSEAPTALWSKERLDGVLEVSGYGTTQLLPLSDGSLLLTNHRAKHPLLVYRVDGESRQVSPQAHPGDPGSWVVALSTEWLLLGQPWAKRCVLWNPVTGAHRDIEGEVPPGFSVCSDTHQGEAVVVVNVSSSGSDAGFDWSGDYTHLAVFDVARGELKTPFHRVEDLDLRDIVLQDDGRLIGYGFGRVNPFFRLMDRELADQSTERERWNSFYMSHSEGVSVVGTDADRALVLFGRKSNEGQRALMRCSLASPRVETIATIEDGDIFYQSATRLIDGATLLFCRRRFSSDVELFLYDRHLSCAGLLPDTQMYHVAQATDGRVYVANSEEVFVLSAP